MTRLELRLPGSDLTTEPGHLGSLVCRQLRSAVDLGGPLEGLGKAAGSGAHDHAVLHVHARVGVGAAAVDFQVSTGRMPLAAPVNQAPRKAPIYTEEEIAASLEEGLDAGVIEEQEHQMVRNVFRLDDRQIGSMMIPRVAALGSGR